MTISRLLLSMIPIALVVMIVKSNIPASVSSSEYLVECCWMFLCGFGDAWQWYGYLFGLCVATVPSDVTLCKVLGFGVGGFSCFAVSLFVVCLFLAAWDDCGPSKQSTPAE